MIKPTLFYICILLNGYIVGQAGTFKQLKFPYKITILSCQKLDLTGNSINITRHFLPTIQVACAKAQFRLRVFISKTYIFIA